MFEGCKRYLEIVLFDVSLGHSLPFDTRQGFQLWMPLAMGSHNIECVLSLPPHCTAMRRGRPGCMVLNRGFYLFGQCSTRFPSTHRWELEKGIRQSPTMSQRNSPTTTCGGLGQRQTMGAVDLTGLLVLSSTVTKSTMDIPMYMDDFAGILLHPP
jgi:hypothetical protein